MYLPLLLDCVFVSPHYSRPAVFGRSVNFGAVSWLRRLVVGLSPRSSVSYPRPFHVGILLGNMALRQFFWTLPFLCQYQLTKFPSYNFIYLLSSCSTRMDRLKRQAEGRTDRRTDMTKLKTAFRNSANMWTIKHNFLQPVCFTWLCLFQVLSLLPVYYTLQFYNQPLCSLH
jgi:hypothetical protein